MSGVGIADLKSHLSEHLREVGRGHALTVLDRGRPVARLIPVESAGQGLTVRLPRAGSPSPGRVALPPPLDRGVDVLGLLLDERQVDR